MRRNYDTLIALTAFIMTLFFTCLFLEAAYGDDKTDEKVLSEYVQWFFRNTKPGYTKKALQYVPIVVDESRAQDWDPLLIGIMISCESSWKSGIVANSSLKERGLLQTHGKAAQGYDLGDPVQEVRAGVSWLSQCREVCGNKLDRVLACYGSGDCNKTDLPFIRRRLRIYENMKEKFRKDNQ